MKDTMQVETTKVLLLEDNPGDKRLVEIAFEEIADLRSEIMHCETLAQALACLEHNRPDVALIDLGLPDAEGLEPVRRIRSAAPWLPIVVLTVMNDQRVGMQALREGAQDYLIKTHIDWRSIWRALCYAIERQRVQMEVFNLSFNDDLTGLYNRRGFLMLAQQQIKLARRIGKPFLIVFVDLDGMKSINDTFGHQEGNHALVDTASLLRDSFRQCDILARIGGDEFVVFVTDASAENADTVRQRLRRKLELCNAQPSRRYQLSFSVGMVQASGKISDDLEEIIMQADAAMYEEKESHRRAYKLEKSLAAGDAGH